MAPTVGCQIMKATRPSEKANLSALSDVQQSEWRRLKTSPWMSAAGIASGLRAEQLALLSAAQHGQRVARSGFTELVAVALFLLMCIVAWEIGGWELPLCILVGSLAIWAATYALRDLLSLASELLRWVRVDPSATNERLAR
jgi:hypothetical protein